MTTISILLISAASMNAAPRGELLDFTATWCGPCQQMSTIVSRLKRQGYPIRKVDVDQDRDLANKYRIESIPAFVLVVDGKEVNRIEGMTSEGQLKRMLMQIPTTEPPARRTEPREMASTPRPAPRRRTAPSRELFPPTVDQQPSEPKRKKGFQIPFFPRKRDQRESAAEELANTDEPPVFRANHDLDRKLKETQNVNVAFATSTRIRVKDEDGINFGSGTIIESRPGRTIILTCGHMFRDLKKDSTVEVDVFGGGRFETFVGQVLQYDLEADIGLVAIPTESELTVAGISADGAGISCGARAYSVGCSGGEKPSKQQLRVTALNRYRGPENIECTGVPEQGRSGGGLFSENDELIGVCIAADPRDRRGLYAGLKAVHQLLEQSGLAHLANGGNAIAGASDEGSLDARAGLADSNPMSKRRLEVDGGQKPMERNPADSFGKRTIPNGLAAVSRADGIQGTIDGMGEAEVVCIIRPLNEPQAASRVVIINRASPKFVRFLTEELNQQPQQTMGRHEFERTHSSQEKPTATGPTATGEAPVHASVNHSPSPMSPTLMRMQGFGHSHGSTNSLKSTQQSANPTRAPQRYRRSPASR